jgi:hypothetical protein
MSKFLSLALFASSAAAITTTALWMPGTEVSNFDYGGNVVNIDGDTTTLSLDIEAATMEDSMVSRNAYDSINDFY